MRIVFMGTPAAAVPSLRKIVDEGHDVVAVYCQPDRPVGRGQTTRHSPVKTFAVAAGLSIQQPTKIKTDEVFEIFKKHGADVAVVVAYGRILPKSFLTAFPKGAINVHFSLLPKYRGAAPVNWAIVDGESETGVTIMQMDAGLDTGDILLQHATSIDKSENSIDLTNRLSILGAELLSETLANVDRLNPREQNDYDASYAPLLKKEDGLANWQMTAAEIANRVRGFQPFPGVYTFFRNKRLQIFAADPIVTSRDADHGSLIEAQDGVLEVKCGGNSALGIKEVQLEGKRRMSTRDFLNGNKLSPGEILG
ncbi:MAG: methionyl-tRNA formyltransferase [Pyrinomonadaceae bacterium]